MAGGVVATGTPLVHRVEHGANWSRLLSEGNDPDHVAASADEVHLQVLEVALAELNWLHSVGAVEPGDATRWRAVLEDRAARDRRRIRRRTGGWLRRG
jgi:hypothetical protein